MANRSDLPDTLPPRTKPEPQTPLGETVPEAATMPALEGDSPATTAPFERTAGPVPATFPTIPGFVIEKELGRGGMGVVYAATQLGLNRRVALKMIKSDDLATEAQRLRFLFEAEL